MKDNQYRYDNDVEPDHASGMIREVLELHGHNVSAITAPSSDADARHADNAMVTGTARVQEAVDEAREYRSILVDYEFRPTVDMENGYDFRGIQVTLWVPKEGEQVPHGRAPSSDDTDEEPALDTQELAATLVGAGAILTTAGIGITGQTLGYWGAAAPVLLVAAVALGMIVLSEARR